jgi:nucleotide-binding universal stress UspA family protein
MVAPSNGNGLALRPLSMPVRSAGVRSAVPLDLSRIMVPLDGSTLAESALATTLDLARGSAGSLVLLRAAELELDDSVGAQVRRLRDAESYLSSLERRLRRTSSVDVVTTVADATAPRAILEGIRLHRVGMVVMTTHGRGGFGRLLVGRVAESVIRNTRVPILLLHPDGAPLERAFG